MRFLRSLYAVAIAILIAASVGFGISAFYPEPEFPDYPAALERVGDDPTEREERLIQEQERKEEAYDRAFSRYNQVVAVISIGVAVLLLVGSILWLRRVPIIGDGATLGAVFTLFYGLLRAIMTESEVFRFVAVAVGLAVVLALVYLKFVRGGGAEEGPAV